MTVQIIIGDAIEELKKLPDESVDCIVTSPPYWGLRDYGVDGQMGLEGTLAEHIAALVDLFEECRRVLKPHGTLWLNYGDCYATTPNGRSADDTKEHGNDDRTFRDKPFSTVGPIYGSTSAVTENKGPANGTGRRGGGNNPAGPIEKTPQGGYPAAEQVRRFGNAPRPRSHGVLKPKDLCMIPNRLAIALQDAGWWVRSEIIWGKPNPMPDSSGNYRPSTAHEKIFLLAKSADAPVYVARDTGEVRFDPDLTERCSLVTDPNRDGPRWRKMGHFYDASAVRLPVSKNTHLRLSQDVASQIGSARANGGGKTNGNMKAVGSRIFDPGKGNRDNPSFDAAMQLPPEARLLRNYEPDLEYFNSQIHPEVWEITTAAYSEAHFATFPPSLVVPCIMGGCPKGGVVLDPFGGSGTTGLVAQALQRDAILIELNPEYAQMAKQRIHSGKLAGGRKIQSKSPTSQCELFDEAAA